MKKIRNLGIIFAGLLLTLSACGADAHTHTFSSDWSKDAEYHWHAATCEHTEEVSEKAKHTWNEGRVVTPATCHSVGVKEFACTVCGQTKQENIPMLDHSWESGWSKDATYHWKKCTSEGCNEIAQKAEHTWDAGTNIRPADCHNKALTRYTCTVCGQIKEVEGALGDHVWESGYHHDATHHWKECTVDGCGETTVKEAHEWGTGSITTNPTYTTDGVLTYTCVCGETKTEVIHKLEENAKPSALAQKDDYALETFGDPENKVLAYAAADVAYNDDLQSYAWKYEVEGSQEKWLNYPTSYLSAGLFFLEFDYYVVQAGSGYFYLELWCNDTQADNVTFRVENMAVGTKLHAKYDVNFTGKTVTKGMIKVHSYQGAGQYEFYLDNVKLIKRADLAYDEPLVLASVDGGKFGYKYSEELGAEAYNFVSNGAIAYEKFYLRGKEAVPAAKYEFSFDYAFSRFETNEMWITIYEKTNGSPVLETRISNTTVEQKHSQTLVFTLSHELDVIRIMTSNVAGVVDMSLNHLVLSVAHDDEPNSKPAELVDVGDYALETFGDPDNKVLAYSSSQYDEEKGSFVMKQAIGVGQEVFINLDKAYTAPGYYTLEFDYWVSKPGSGFFYIALWCNDNQSDCAELKVTDMSTSGQLHAVLNCNFAGKSVTKNFIKMHTYQATEETEFYLDNVKLTKEENYNCPDAAGGTCEYVNNAVLGMRAYHIVSKGEANYEPFYFKPKAGVVVPAGTYTLTFDYAYASYDTNTMYIGIFDVDDGGTASAEINNFDVSLNAKHSYSIDFTIDADLMLFRIMTANAGVIDMSIANIKIVSKA